MTSILGFSIAATFVFRHLLPCWNLQSSMQKDLNQSHYESALRRPEQAQNRKPCLCDAEARAALASALIQAVHVLTSGAEPDFRRGSTLVKRYFPLVRESPEIGHMVGNFKAQLLDYIRNAPDPERALAAAEMARGAFDDPELAAQLEMENPALLRRLAQHRISQGRLEEALGTLGKLVNTKQAPAILFGESLELAAAVTEQVVRAHIAQRNYQTAFQILADAEKNFRGPAMDRVSRKFDIDVFGRPLGPHPARLQSPIPSGPSGEKSVARIAVRNATLSRVQIVYRGPTAAEVSLAPNGVGEVTLHPGAYLVGAFDLDKPAGQTYRGEFRIAAGRYAHALVSEKEGVLFSAGVLDLKKGAAR